MRTQADWRRLTYAWLDVQAVDRGRGNRWLNAGLVILIALNALAVILETVPSIYAVMPWAFDIFDGLSVAVFSIEYLARVWSSVEAKPDCMGSPLRRWYVRLSYILSPLALIDLLAIAPFYLQWILPIDLRALRVLRLLRVFKLTRYFPALSLLLEVLRQELRSIGAVLSILLLVVIFAANLAYLVEHPAQPDVFAHIPGAMYWAVITLTTVGYGDMTPVTGLGQALGAVIAVIGVGMVALPAGILASAFSEKLRRSRRRYEAEVSAALSDGLVTHEEQSHLDALRIELGLRLDDAKTILREEVARRQTAAAPVSPPSVRRMPGSGDDLL